MFIKMHCRCAYLSSSPNGNCLHKPDLKTWLMKVSLIFLSSHEMLPLYKIIIYKLFMNQKRRMYQDVCILKRCSISLGVCILKSVDYRTFKDDVWILRYCCVTTVHFAPSQEKRNRVTILTLYTDCCVITLCSARSRWMRTLYTDCCVITLCSAPSRWMRTL